MSRKRVGIIQSNYIPWKGYFDFIASVDEFIILDEVQYTRRDWRNRNKIKTSTGLQWLTIPVVVKGKYDQRIDETMVADQLWIDKHTASLKHAYSRSKHFSEIWPDVQKLYDRVRTLRRLSDVNEVFIRGICELLDITTPIHRSTEYPSGDGKNERLIAICQAAGGNEYLSGPAARGYIDEALWANSGIAIHYKSYEGFPVYEQLNGEYESAVSVLDLLFNCGSGSKSLYRALG